MSSAPSNQPSLSERLRGGDVTALGPLFDSHRPQLKRMVRFRMDRRLQGRVDISDVVQQGLYRCGATAGPLRRRLRTLFPGLAAASCGAVHGRPVPPPPGRSAPWTCVANSNWNVPDVLGNLTLYGGRPRRADDVAQPKGRSRRVRSNRGSGAGRNVRHRSEVLALRHFEEMTNNQGRGKSWASRRPPPATATFVPSNACVPS